jgi:hypothetical protein
MPGRSVHDSVRMMRGTDMRVAPLRLSNELPPRRGPDQLDERDRGPVTLERRLVGAVKQEARSRARHAR